MQTACDVEQPCVLGRAERRNTSGALLKRITTLLVLDLKQWLDAISLAAANLLNRLNKTLKTCSVSDWTETMLLRDSITRNLSAVWGLVFLWSRHFPLSRESRWIMGTMALCPVYLNSDHLCGFYKSRIHLWSSMHSKSYFMWTCSCFWFREVHLQQLFFLWLLLFPMSCSPFTFIWVELFKTLCSFSTTLWFVQKMLKLSHRSSLLSLCLYPIN